MTNLERAIAALEASTETDLARLCGADRLTGLYLLLRRWNRLLAATAPRRNDADLRGSSPTKSKNRPKRSQGPCSVGVLALLASGERSP